MNDAHLKYSRGAAFPRGDAQTQGFVGYFQRHRYDGSLVPTACSAEVGLVALVLVPVSSFPDRLANPGRDLSTGARRCEAGHKRAYWGDVAHSQMLRHMPDAIWISLSVQFSYAMCLLQRYSCN
jgi:hypothetical protein